MYEFYQGTKNAPLNAQGTSLQLLFVRARNLGDTISKAPHSESRRTRHGDVQKALQMLTEPFLFNRAEW